ncbi:hypothetical protein [Pseudomonas sp. SDO5271_S396]
MTNISLFPAKSAAAPRPMFADVFAAASSTQQVAVPPPVPSHFGAYAPELKDSRVTIYGTDTVLAPDERYTMLEREQRVEAYAGRVKAQLAEVESGSEGERNVKFQNVRLFTEPSGYYSAGLLAAGYDPHEKITVTFTSYTGLGQPTTLTNTEKRSYFAWELAAGALLHDRVERGGPINFNFMHINEKDRARVDDLESLGKKLQGRWEEDIAAPMRDDEGVIAQRSGKADAYVVRGTLRNLREDTDAFAALSSEGKAAVQRTLDQNGQVIIPNVYGYPLGGYAFIPYETYDGNYKNRPNKGLMIDLKNGALHEIQGDESFALWAKANRDNLLRSFNARDRQGGKDAHWPRTGYVLDSLILNNSSRFPGYHNLLSDESIPVRETFNFTRARDSDYPLEFSNLDDGIAAKYQSVNAKNALWSDQTEVFGSSQQNWKGVKHFWNNTFGYVPVIGSAGNIVFGVHDSLYGMTADDRLGGSAAAIISSLQLAHEIGPTLVETGVGEPSIDFKSTIADRYHWRKNTAQASEFELVRKPNPVPAVDTPTTFAGMREIELDGRKYFAADKPDAGDGEHYLLRVRDPNDPEKLASSGKIAKPDDAGVWRRRGVVGGKQTEPVRLKEHVSGTTLQRPATPDQIFELTLRADGGYALTSQDPMYPNPVRASGAYAFVIRAEEPDKVYLGSMAKGLTPTGKPYAYTAHTNPDWVEGHSALTQGLRSMRGGTTDVLFAGTVYFKGGKPEFWTNSSGHYQPPAELRNTNLTPAVKRLLPEEKFVEEDQMTGAQHKAWHDSTHMTQEEKDDADDFMSQKYATNDSGNEISDDED